MHCRGTEHQWAVVSLIVNFPAHLFVAGGSLFNLARFRSLCIVTQRCALAVGAVDFSLRIPSCRICTVNLIKKRWDKKRKEKKKVLSQQWTLWVEDSPPEDWQKRSGRLITKPGQNTRTDEVVEGKEQGEQQRTWKLDTRGSQTASEITLRTQFFFHNIQFQSLTLKRTAIFEITVLFNTVHNVQPAPTIWKRII